MDNPAEYVVIGWKMMLALVGGSGLAGALGIGLLARFTNVFDAYAGERAKIEAQFKSVEKLVANTEKLTAATETIKAKVTDETWDRQQRWTAKHAMYRELIESLNAIFLAEVKLQAVKKHFKPHEDKYLEVNDQVISTVMTYNTLVRVAGIVVSDAALGILVRVRPTLESDGSPLEALRTSL